MAFRARVEEEVENAEIRGERKSFGKGLMIGFCDERGLHASAGRFRVDNIPQVGMGIVNGIIIFSKFEGTLELQVIHEFFQYLGIEIQQEFFFALEESGKIIYIIIVIGGVFIGGLDSLEMKFLPIRGIINLHVLG